MLVFFNGATCQARAGPSHRGLVTVELLYVVPIVAALFFAVLQFSLLLSANNQLKLASQMACRVGSLPSSDPAVLEAAVREAARHALLKQNLIGAHRLVFRPGRHSGDPVLVEIRVPMKAAAPDMLGFIGFSLKDRELVARTVMRKE